MSFSYVSTVKAPLDEVFEWHSRPGAIVRLMPPWQPVRVIEEAASLRDGRAVLGVPGGLRWVAEHQPEAYDPPRRFVDQLGAGSLGPAGALVRWSHAHNFAEAGHPGSTQVNDEVDTNLPLALLERLFAYRHRQLEGDLGSLSRTAAWWQGPPLSIAVSGSSGLVGAALTAFLSTAGHQVVRLVRRPVTSPGERFWDSGAANADLLAGVDAVVHLAGAPIGGRFTAAHKRLVRDSRVGPTRALAESAALAARRGHGPSCFVSASAIGYYGSDRGDEPLTETSDKGGGFLADLVAQWEAASEPAASAGIRVVQVRTGIVQSPRGGALRLLYPLFLVGLGGRLGDGRQWMSWVGIDDLVDIYYRAVTDASLAGPVNAVSPEPVRNRQYTASLARTLHRPAIFPVPELGPRVLLGREGAEEMAEASQRVLPGVLTDKGHQFRHPLVEDALAHVLGRFG